jgi:cobalt-precorrin 5A hydrolase
LKIAVFTLNSRSENIARVIAGIKSHRTSVFPGNGGSLGKLVAGTFRQFDALVFVMAAGIAVRVTAPLLKGKEEDPAVVVIDPRGQFAISLLSGHLGGANRLAGELAEALGATPVITTATDVLGRISVEEWALHFNLGITGADGLVKVNGAILRGEDITVFSELHPDYFRGMPLAEPGKTVFLPLSRMASPGGAAGATVAVARANTVLPGQADLGLVVRDLVLGVGCRRGVPKDRIIGFVAEVLSKEGLPLKAIKKVTSMDIKKNEEGLLEAARELKVPAEFYSAGELHEIMMEHGGLSCSEFVLDKAGVGGVCEPAAIMGSNRGTLIVRKQSREGIALAVAGEKLPWWE